MDICLAFPNIDLIVDLIFGCLSMIGDRVVKPRVVHVRLLQRGILGYFSRERDTPHIEVADSGYKRSIMQATEPEPEPEPKDDDNNNRFIPITTVVVTDEKREDEDEDDETSGDESSGQLQGPN